MEKDYKGLISEALDKEATAGFVGMTFIRGACAFATKNKYKLQKEQELRSLLLNKNDTTWLMFFLKLQNGKDICVVSKGERKLLEDGRMILDKVTPVKIVG